MDEHVVFVLAVVVGILLLRWLLLWLAERYLGRHRKLRRTPLTQAADVRDGKSCRVVGVVRRDPDHAPVAGRFTGKPALIHISQLMRHDRTSEDEDHRQERGDE